MRVTGRRTVVVLLAAAVALGLGLAGDAFLQRHFERQLMEDNVVFRPNPLAFWRAQRAIPGAIERHRATLGTAKWTRLEPNATQVIHELNARRRAWSAIKNLWRLTGDERLRAYELEILKLGQLLYGESLG